MRSPRMLSPRTRPVAVSGAAAGAIFVACLVAFRAGRHGSDREAEPGSDAERSAIPGAGRAGIGKATGTVAALGDGAREAIPAAVAGAGLEAATRGSRRGGDRRRGEGAGTAGGDSGGSEGPGTERDGKDTGRAEGDGLLAGPELTSALRLALEEEDLGALQGLLISGLTQKGTRFTAEQMPDLFEALVGVDDFGLEKLILTHIERIEGTPEGKADGYLRYLQESKNPSQADDVFRELVRLGPEASFDALRQMALEPTRERLRGPAVEALADLKDERAVPILREGLRGAQDARLARPWLSALAKLGGHDALGTLIEYASRDGNEASLPVLSSVQDRSAVPILADALNDRGSAPFQRAALSRLKAFGDPAALDGIERFLRHGDGALAREAIDALSRIRDPDSARLLEDFAARQTDPKLAGAAAGAARRLRAWLDAARGSTAGSGGPRAAWAEGRAERDPARGAAREARPGR